MKAELKIKPLSVNKVWQGRRFKTQDYKNYEEEVYYNLPKKHVSGFVHITFSFYIKSFKRSDVDNFIKPLLDVIVKKGLIQDDRFVKKVTAEKYQSEEEKIIIDIQQWKN